MSTKIMAAVWPMALPLVQKAVLVSLADNANDSGVCWPAIPTIAARVCACERAIHKAIAGLERAGYLSRDERPGRSTVYRIDVEKLATTTARGSGVHVVQGCTRGGGRGALRAPRTVIEPSQEQEQEQVRTSNAPSSTSPDDDEAKAVSVTKPKPAARGTRLPTDWTPGADGLAFAHGLGVPSSEVEAFCDYWHGVAGARGVKLDWPATWRNWCRKASNYKTGGYGNGQGIRSAGTGRESASERAARKLAAFVARNR